MGCLLALVLVAGLQDLGALIEALRSDKAADRDQAVRKLKDLGKAAVPALEKAARDTDPEVAKRAEAILRFHSVKESLSENLRKTIPGIEERLSNTDPHEWTLAFLEAAETKDDVRRYPGLTATDLGPLAAGAVRGAEMLPEKWRLCERIQERHLGSVAPDLARFLEDQDQDVRIMAISTLGKLKNPKVLPQLLTLLNDPAPRIRREAASAVGTLGDRSAVGRIVECLKDDDEEVRAIAVVVLGEWRIKEQAPAIANALGDDVHIVRKAAVQVLADLGATETTGAIALLLQDTREEVRLVAAVALCRLGSPAGVPVLLEIAAKEPKTSLTPLNWLRSPELMKRLRHGDYRPDPDLKKIPFKVWLEKLSGLKVDDSKAPQDTALNLEVSGKILAHWNNVLDPTDEMAAVSGCGFVLESDRIRFLAHADALSFWRAWHAEQTKPKK